MNKRNFILNFALKSKYNFFACLVALLVLIFSVSSITYAWIEGATSLTINAPKSTVYSATDKAVKITSSPNNNVVHLKNYIDPQVVCLAPAKGKINATTNEIDVKFDGRAANTNDISNNYLFFEVKVQCDGLVTGLAFKNGDSITMSNGGQTEVIPGIKTGITLLDKNRNVIKSNILTTTQIGKGELAVDGMTKDGEYILQFKIWNESDDSANSNIAGREVNINLNLIPQKDTTTIYLVDNTNNASSKNLLGDKTVVLKYDSIEISSELKDGKYEFTDVPVSKLSNLTFIAKSGTTEYASWNVTNVAKNSTYTVYGDPANGTGTFGAVKEITLFDASNENLLKQDNADIMINNGVDSVTYAMYKAADTQYTAYVPDGNSEGQPTSNGKTVTFTNGQHTAAGDAFDNTKPYYYIFGEAESDSTACVGFWHSASNILTDGIQEISIKATTKSGVGSSYSVYASYPGSLNDQLYKANYDSANSVWKINAYDSVDKVWMFKAANGTNTYTFENDSEDSNKRLTGDLVYTFTANNAGTWKYKGSGIDPAILTGEKVSFYAGIDTNWKKNDTYLLKGSDTTGYEVVAQKKSGDYTNKEVNNKTFAAAKFTNLEKYNFNITFEAPADNSWKGKPIGTDDIDAQGGKFYGLYSTENKYNYIQGDGPVTGTTKVNNQNSSAADNAIVLPTTGNTKVPFDTTLSSRTSLLGESLYVEYYICDADNESAGYDCLNPYVSGVSGTEVNNTTMSSTFDIQSYASDTSKTYKLRTVLTDGSVYYISDTDYIRFADSKTVTIQSNDDVTFTAKRNGTDVSDVTSPITVYAGDTLVVTATQKSTSGQSKFTWTADGATGTQNPPSTQLATESTYTLNITPETSNTTTLSVELEKYYKITVNNTNTTAATTIIKDSADNVVNSGNYVKAGTTLNITATKVSDPYKINWSATGSQTTTQTDSLIDAGATATYTVTSIANDTTVKLDYTRLYTLTVTKNGDDTAQFTVTPKIGDSALSLIGEKYYVPSGNSVDFALVQPEGNYSLKWTVKIGSGEATVSGTTPTGVSITDDTTVSLDITKLTYRKVTVKSAAHAIVSAKYKSLNGADEYSINLDEEQNIPIGAEITLTSKTADGIVTDAQYSALNGHKFLRFNEVIGSAETLLTNYGDSTNGSGTDATDNIKTHTLTYVVPNGTDAISLDTVTENETLYVDGVGLSKPNAWHDSTSDSTPKMIYVENGNYFYFEDKATNVNNNQFKISLMGVENTYKDKKQYSLSYSANKTGDLGLAISSDGYNNFIFTANADTEVVIKYYPTTNTVDVSGRYYTVTASAGKGGSANVSLNGSAATSSVTIDRSSTTAPVLVFTATPNENYVFVNWTDSNGNVLSTENRYSTSNITMTATVNANFKPVDRTVKVADVPNATILVADPAISEQSSGTVGHGTTITINATPDANYTVAKLVITKLDGSTVDRNLTNGSATYTVESDITISAVVEKKASTDRIIYYKNTNSWSTVYAYAWIDSPKEENKQWPGVEMTIVGDNVYKITLTSSAFNQIIFNDGNGNQTSNIPLPNDGSNYYNNGNWEAYSGATSSTLTVQISGEVLTEDNKQNVKYCAVFKADGNTETSVTMDSQGNGKYTCTIPDGYTKVKIQRKSGLNDEEWNSIDNLTLPSGDCTYTINNWFNGSWS